MAPECAVQNILMSLNTLFELHMKSKEWVSGILTKPALKKGKTITPETLDLATNVYEDDNLSW